MYYKQRSYNVWLLRYKAPQTEFSAILSYFLPYYLINNPKNQNFEKMKKKTKTPGDIIILHLCTTHDNHMMYDSWDMEPGRHNFLSFWAILSFHPTVNPKNQNFQKMRNNNNNKKKHTGYIIILHLCTTNDDHMMHGSWDLRYRSRQIFFLPFHLLTTQKIKILKKLEISTIYTSVTYMTIIWCMVSEILSATDRFFVILGHFLPFYPTNNPKNQNFKRLK